MDGLGNRTDKEGCQAGKPFLLLAQGLPLAGSPWKSHEQVIAQPVHGVVRARARDVVVAAAPDVVLLHGVAVIRRVGARIWLSRCLRQGKTSRFSIEIKELKVPRTANQADDVKWVTAAMQQQFEAWIREAPEQWMWSNRRWS